jgi:anti-sigma factor RsiW
MENKQKEYELLSAYIDGELNKDELHEVNSFLGSSTEARQELEKLLQVKSFLHAVPQQAAPLDFLDDLEARAQEITEQKAPRVYALPVRTWLWSGSLAAAACAAIVLYMGMKTPAHAVPLDVLMEAHTQVTSDTPVSQHVLSAAAF